MKKFFNSEGSERAGLRSEISKIETALLNSYESMQLVSDEGLLDFYAYMIKAYEAKHKHLLRKLKKI